MTTPAQGNLSGPSSKQQDAGFEASGLSPEEAERLAAAFKPSWEFDEAPFTQGNGLDAGQIQALGAVDGEARTVAAHAPPQRVETHEPEVSVIIDRSITAAEIDAQRRAAQPGARPPPAPAVSPFASPAFTAPVFPQPRAVVQGGAVPEGAVPQRVAPVMRSPRTADESLELPASLKKSNKGLFIGLGGAAAAAALVLVAHGAMSSSSDESPSPTATATATAAVAAETAQRAAIPLVPPPVAVPPPVVAVPPAPITPPAPVAVTPAPRTSVVAAAKASHASPAAPPPAHHPAPRNPPKAAAGGIVRDVPF